jgi:hypothetical protein
MEKEKRSPYTTTIVNTADLASNPGDSATTQPSTAIRVAGPPPPAPITDAPEASFTPGMTAKLAQARAKLQARTWRNTIIIGGVVALIVAAIIIPLLHSAVNAQQTYDTRAAASYTGWVGTGPNGAKMAIQILPCQHSPCSNITLDVAIQDAPLDTPQHYTLGGGLLNDHEIYVSAFTSGGIIYSADILMDHPLQGSVTTGHARMTFKRGSYAETFSLTSATLNQISQYFGA